MEDPKDVERWQGYSKRNKEVIEYYQKRIDDAGGKPVKYTWKQKIRAIKEILTK